MEMPERTASSVTEVTASLGNISNTIVGTGNLEADTPVETQMPSGITVSKVYVESGDYVSQGDVLAEVDEVSVLTAIEEAQEQIEEIDSQINEILDTAEDEEITAKVAGRVKRIFIEEEGDVAQCMLENGALMLLSIDGKMAVDLKDTAVQTEKDDTVTVTLSDETQVEGTVAEVNGSSCTVTMTDSGVGMDDTAVVTNADGTELGTGTVYIHQQLEVTGTMGTVTQIQVAEDETVESEEVLLTLSSSEDSAEYQTLLASRTALTNRLTELLALLENGCIKASMDGTIEEVYVSGKSGEEESTDSSTASQSIPVSNMSYSQSRVSGISDLSYSQSGVSGISDLSYSESGVSGGSDLSSSERAALNLDFSQNSEADASKEALSQSFGDGTEEEENEEESAPVPLQETSASSEEEIG